MRQFPLILLLAIGFLVGCGEGWPPAAESSAPGGAVEPRLREVESGSADDPSAAEAIPSARTATVVFLGDSLTAGLGVARDDAFPALVATALRQRGILVEVVNAGVSGDTTAGGLERLDWVLGQHPDVLVVGLGANDGLRGLPLEETEANLRRIVLRARDRGARVLLLGMLLPPNYGPQYAEAFAAIFPRLAEELEIALVPFLLEGVGGEPEMNQADGIHPNAVGHRRVAENVVPYLAALLEG